ncbi:hypothetical protein Godav_007181 [Gossypium davidsonii]|uniref:MSP domain-containing protein n=1 Tax=Gossypium davidsonii TaxID=34287 RepID=A0A7J8S6S0_GOSDV|nr:hypothetical protein [Gossypium davidsonii]
MSTGELLSSEPSELKFPFELKKQISCSLQLSNKTDNYVAFKVKTTNPKKYCVRPNTGVVLPRSTCDVIVTMQAQKEAPPDMQCRDKFLLQSVKVNDGLTANDITAEMFNKEAGNVVEECKLKVVYISPPSTAQEGSEEGPSDGKHANAAEFASGARAFTEGLEAQEISSEEKALMTKLTEEKNKAIQQSNKLRHELQKALCVLLIKSLWYSSVLPLPSSFVVMTKQQKRWWCVIHVCHVDRLARHNYGIYHEEVVSDPGPSEYFPSTYLPLDKYDEGKGRGISSRWTASPSIGCYLLALSKLAELVMVGSYL